MQLEDPYLFFYTIQLDDDNQIMNIFWADVRSIVDYGQFEDVIVLTQLIGLIYMIYHLLHSIGLLITNKYNIFGATLLSNESKIYAVLESFNAKNK